jgi:transposase
MFVPALRARIWLCTEAVDMRKSFAGLSALVKHRLLRDPLNGDYFVFVNRRCTLMKVLYFEPSGYCLWSKRLEQGRFQVRARPDGQRMLNAAELQWLIEGIEVQRYRQFKRYRHAA